MSTGAPSRRPFGVMYARSGGGRRRPSARARVRSGSARRRSARRAARGSGRARREVGSLAVEHVDEQHPRETPSRSQRSHSRPVWTSTPATRVHDDERSLDDAQRRDRVRLEARRRPALSIRLIFVPCHSRWQIDADSDICRLCSSSSQSDTVDALLDATRGGSSLRPGRAAPRRATSSRFRDGRRRRRCESSSGREQAWTNVPPFGSSGTRECSPLEQGSGDGASARRRSARATGHPARRAFRRRIAFVCSCETRDSVTPSTSPISRSVSSS